METASLSELSYSLHKDLAREFGAETTGYRELTTVSVVLDASTSNEDKKQKKNKSSNVSGKSVPDAPWINGNCLSKVSKLGGPDTTAQVHPRLLTRRLAEEVDSTVIGKATEILYDSSTGRPRGVRAIRRQRRQHQQGQSSPPPSSKTEDQLEEFTLECTDVVIAAGPWTGKLMKELFVGDEQVDASDYNITGSRAHSVGDRFQLGRKDVEEASFSGRQLPAYRFSRISPPPRLSSAPRSLYPHMHSSLRFVQTRSRWNRSSTLDQTEQVSCRGNPARPATDPKSETERLAAFYLSFPLFSIEFRCAEYQPSAKKLVGTPSGYLCGPTDREPLPEYADQVSIDENAIDRLKAEAVIISPTALGEKAVVEAAQACYLPISNRTGSPILGKLKEGVYFAGGHSCWGEPLEPLRAASSINHSILIFARSNLTTLDNNRHFARACYGLGHV